MKLSLVFLVVLLTQTLSANTFDKGMKEYQKGNYKKSAEYFKVSCGENQYGACINLGFAYANGQGVKKDVNQAIKYLKKACNKKSNVYGGCANLAVLYGKVLNDNKKAIKYARISCEQGDASGCLELGYIYYKMNDKKNSKKYYEQSCKLGNGNACRNAGLLYNEESNKKQALKFTKDGCKLNNADSCLNLVMILKDDSDESMYFLKKACELGSTQACTIANNKHQTLYGYQLSTNDIAYVHDARDGKCKDTALSIGKPIKSILKDLKNNIFWKFNLGLSLQPSNTYLFSSQSKCMRYKKELEFWDK